METRFSIIIPVLHEAAAINGLLEHLRTLALAEECEFIVVDGGPEGDTLRAIAAGKTICMASPPGRGRQMNAGAARAVGDILLFLHADTHPPADILIQMGRAMHDPSCLGGAFSLEIGSRKRIFRLIAALATLRCRLTRIPYGDQAIFIRREAFQRLGGYPEIPIMEDVAFMRRIKKSGGKITILPQCVVTSPRRWEEEGPIYATLRNWLLLMAYNLGLPPEKLVKYYRNGGSPHVH